MAHKTPTEAADANCLAASSMGKRDAPPDLHSAGRRNR
jgi:hypothetical protein